MVIQKNLDELDENYNKRIWFIKEIDPKTKKDTENAIRLSNIWINIISLKCIYPLQVMHTIHDILKNTNKKMNKIFE